MRSQFASSGEALPSGESESAAYNDYRARPHGLAVRTPAFHAGNRRFESGWGYY